MYELIEQILVNTASGILSVVVLNALTFIFTSLVKSVNADEDKDH